mgnify:CR=1 FL=1
MSFSEKQVKQLASKLNPKHVRTREADGRSLSYIEGWHAIAEANRIFGFDGWDRETVFEKCVWSAKAGSHHACGYIVKVRISVRAGEVTIRREGSGSSDGRGETPAQAHDVALKAAETDATKRALATFGNPFGLALYDKAFSGVRGGAPKPNGGRPTTQDTWVVRSSDGRSAKSCKDAREFEAMLEQGLNAAGDITQLFGLWSQNLDGLAQLKALGANGSHDRAARLITLFKERSRALTDGEGAAGRVDKSRLTINEPKRVRSKEHLAFVARQPCIVCGRKPAQTHHLRHAQPRAMACKVSDEFTVPLCSAHHDAVHRTGDERGWWRELQIDPLEAARTLWRQRSGHTASGG